MTYKMNFKQRAEANQKLDQLFDEINSRFFSWNNGVCLNGRVQTYPSLGWSAVKLSFGWAVDMATIDPILEAMERDYNLIPSNAPVVSSLDCPGRVFVFEIKS